MKLKYNFEYVDMGEEIVCVPVGKNANAVHGVLKLNKEGQEIVSLLEQDTSVEMITSQLATKYENDKESLLEYVNNVIDTLRAVNLLID